MMLSISKLINSILLSILLITLVANPAPASVEVADLLLLLLPCLFAAICIYANQQTHAIENNVLLAVLLYLIYLLISILISLGQGLSLLTILRSCGPYLNFFPLIFMGLLPARLIDPVIIAASFILVGALQASYQLYLYLTHTAQVVNTLNVLRNRITLLEPRTTLPLVLATAILPLVFFTYRGWTVKLLAGLLVFFGFAAGAATLTRSIILSMFLGWLMFMLLYSYQQCHVRGVTIFTLLKRFIGYFLVLMIILTILSLVPKISLLEQGILARFFNVGQHGARDYSNGRLYDEWLPALQTWLQAGPLHWLFGLGAGNAFRVLSGEERTYIHNLTLYSLVYGGLYGLFACYWLYWTVVKCLISYALQMQKAIYLAFAALLTSLFFYGQLFAVHKGLAFNAMLFLIISLSLIKPDHAKTQ